MAGNRLMLARRAKLRWLRKRLPHGATSIDARMMNKAIRLAQQAGASGEVPVGAVVYRGSTVLGQAANDREATSDPTGHAEVVAIRRASERLGSWRLEGCTLAVTLEPCAMCAGALVNARLGRLVYGADDPKAGACRSLFNIPEDRRLNHRLSVVGHLREAQCSSLLTNFFRRRRRERALLGAQGDRVVVRKAHQRKAALNSPPGVVCFDLGGVLVRICKDWEHGVRAAGIAPRAHAAGSSIDERRARLLDEYQRGALSGEEFCDQLARLLGTGWSVSDVRAVHDAWILGEYPGVGALVDSLHAAGTRTACLSNTNEAHWRQMHSALPGFRRLQLRLASHELRMNKPDRDIYLAFEAASGCRGSQVVFFDDTRANVDAALAIGWDAHLVDPNSDTAEFMRQHLTRRRSL